MAGARLSRRAATRIVIHRFRAVPELYFGRQSRTMHSTRHLYPRLFVCPQPLPAPEPMSANVVRSPSGTRAISEMLAGLINDESALYAITREWRYDAAGRRFLRLHALLDEQFSEIGIRLTQLAGRSRDLGAGHATGHGDRANPRSIPADEALESHMLRELLGLHEAMVVSLKRGSLLARDRDDLTTTLLAALTANHEKDAFMLRALLWEVEHPA